MVARISTGYEQRVRVAADAPTARLQAPANLAQAGTN
jgi:hypothetical protein